MPTVSDLLLMALDQLPKVNMRTNSTVEELGEGYVLVQKDGEFDKIEGVGCTIIGERVAPNGSPTVSAGSSLTFSVDASDEDGDSVTYAWLLDGVAESETSSTFSFSPDELQVREHTVQVTVEDGASNDDGTDPSFWWSVNVATSNPPPPPPPPSNDSPFIDWVEPSSHQTLQSGKPLRSV
jgi:hypothetical protein